MPKIRYSTALHDFCTRFHIIGTFVWPETAMSRSSSKITDSSIHSRLFQSTAICIFWNQIQISLLAGKYHHPRAIDSSYKYFGGRVLLVNIVLSLQQIFDNFILWWCNSLVLTG